MTYTTANLTRNANTSSELCESASKMWQTIADTAADGSLYRTLTTTYGVTPDEARLAVKAMTEGARNLQVALTDAARAYQSATVDLSCVVDIVNEARTRNRVDSIPIGG